MQSRAIAVAEQNAAALGQVGLEQDDLNSGNAPPYPVLYSALVSRPKGLFTIRGQTEPFGQYTLFLPPDGTLLEVSFYDPKTKQYGLITPNLSPKARYPLPRFTLFPIDSNALDFDKDGLPDAVENIYGTDPRKADTDGDGIPDGAEVDQGTDPLGGLVAQTGIVATVKTPGAALDVWTGNDLAITAEGASGVSVVNISTIRQPTIIMHIDTPGEAQRVAFSGNFVAVADGSQGLAVIDIADPVTARIVHQINLPGAQAVAAGAGIAYVGTSSGQVSAVDLKHGVVLHQINVTNAVQDVRLADDYLYVLATDRLDVVALTDGVLRVIGSVAVPSVPFLGINQRLFVGGGIAYTTHKNGYDTLDVNEPTKPALITFGKTTQFGWKQIVVNGSGLGFAAVGPNSTDTGPQDVSLYDVSNSRSNNVVVTVFPTPGKARAVSIYNGLGYVADDAAGLQVVNYLPYDAKGVPPTIALAMSFPINGVEEGKEVRVTAQVGDDVQVRNVEFYLDGAKAFTAAAFPFEFRFVTPLLATNKNSFRLRARAVDTGGNFAWTEEIIVPLLPDTTPPHVRQRSPLGGAKVVDSVFAYFDEAIEPATLNSTSFKIISAGGDGRFDTADDANVSGGNVSYRPDLHAASLNFASPLADGWYRAVLTTAVTDLAGNHLTADHAWQFRVADAVFWINPSDGLWSDPLNWSNSAVPGANDSVIIDLEPGGVTVTQTAGAIAVKSLFSNERLVVTGGTLQIPGGTQISKNMTIDRTTIQGGTVTLSEGAKLICVGNIPSTLDGVTLNGDLDVTSQLARVFIRNGLTLTGSVLLDRGGNITFVGDQTFGSGSIVFGGTMGGGGIFPNVLTIQDNNTTLTLGPAVVVRGQLGTVNGNGNLINQGLISADVAGGTLSIDARGFTNTGTAECRNGGSLVISAATSGNTGVINAVGTGALTLADTWGNTGTINASGATVNLGGTFTLPQLGIFNRTDGTVTLTGLLNLTGDTLALNATTGSWQIDRGTIKGGTVTLNEGAKLICVGNIGSTLDGVTLNGDLDVTSTLAQAFIRNGLTLSGSVLLDRGGNITFEGTQTLAGGTIVIGGTLGGGGIFPNTVTVADNTSLTLGPAVVVRGNLGTVNGNGTLINQGLIAADVARGTLTINTGRFDNSGTLAATASGSTLKIQSKPFINTGTMQEQNGGKVVIVP
ncbi:MAG: Ig-like domain-containing protein [Verrucomicrobia bacterium]|nr:Ig-like domain-containing protein [Verrucomicrobiota bacterium]